VDLTLVEDKTMAQLNEQWRQAGGCTDVLSFSHLEESSEPLVAAGQDHAVRDLGLAGPAPEFEADGALVVGEILIAPEFVSRRCRERDWSVSAEFPLLVVHGLLHILGWEHDDDEKREAMQKVEELILAGEGLGHPLRQRS
jgi:probable rRNA maturation factor